MYGQQEDTDGGKRAIPQFVLNGKWIQPYRPGRGFLHQEMSELFGVSYP